MRVLLIGDYPTAMFVLSSEPNYMINMVPVNSSNVLKTIETYVNLCSSTVTDNTIKIYNETPWSQLFGNNIPVLGKIYKLCGWKPDLIIYIYIKNNEPNKLDKKTSMIIEQGDIPLVSTNGLDKYLLRNILLIIDEYKKLLLY